MNELAKRHSELDVREVLVGEIVYDEPPEAMCCEDCGHFHFAGDLCPNPHGACGDYRCCIN